MTDFVIDVEADGPIPGEFSMIEIGIVVLPDLKTFTRKIRPISKNWVPEALMVSGFSREETMKFQAASAATLEFVNFIEENADEKRSTMWSDNPAFDWQFVNYYSHLFVGRNPLGFSARRIGDLWAGFVKNPKTQNEWKDFRKTPHDHSALNDAVANAEALLEIFERIRNRSGSI